MYPNTLLHLGLADFSRIGSPALLSELPGIGEGAGGSQSRISPASPEIRLEQPEESEMDVDFDFSALLQVFLPHASRLHFSFHVPTFIQDSACPEDDSLRPHRCLLSAVALWALCIMGPDGEYSEYESRHLKLSLDALPTAHSSNAGRHRIQAIQTEVLLALYFFNDSRIVEGRYHLSAASTAVVVCGLHRLLASQDAPSSPTTLGSFPGLVLDMPRNALDLGERINLFWAVYALVRCWGVALGSPPTIPDGPAQDVAIKSPIPKALDKYQNVSVDEILSAEGFLVTSFFDGSADYSILTQPSSSRVAFVIATALFERATRIANSQSTIDAAPSVEFIEEIESFGRVITRFNDALREQVSPDPSVTSGKQHGTGTASEEGKLQQILTHSLGNAATLQLYFPLLGQDGADTQCRNVIREIVAQIKHSWDLFQDQLGKMDFFIGIIWLSAARVLLTQLAGITSPSPSASPSLTGSVPERPLVRSSTPEEASKEARRQLIDILRAWEITEDLETLLNAIRRLGETCPLIDMRSPLMGKLCTGYDGSL
ncbi:uncharacterized protein FOMMEDRAFT_150592 [Fomitiporia mediterranea MF3/22]|uniref:uncharacterized protein n=1 Tax=Fomitiporia mediterranea (strain MF3/22) TaxID=694068 RepID=UPI0004407A85|nr:uncharacterized protein FOMMEDRAFT_150592 [Fomitiporia mediterranea MF3/22]EJD07973.1 hypothetical protein FOMMEDRAFT_150592 [Fomitiporia mediterranea MF3/22]